MINDAGKHEVKNWRRGGIRRGFFERRWRRPALQENSPHPAASHSLGGDPPPPGEGDSIRGSTDAGLPLLLARSHACTERAATTLPWRGRVGEPRAYASSEPGWGETSCARPAAVDNSPNGRDRC